MGVCCGSTADSSRQGAIPTGKIKNNVFVSRPRPFDSMKSDDEIKQWAMKEYMDLNTPKEDGTDFVGKTSYMIAYER